MASTDFDPEAQGEWKRMAYILGGIGLIMALGGIGLAIAGSLIEDDGPDPKLEAFRAQLQNQQKFSFNEEEDQGLSKFARRSSGIKSIKIEPRAVRLTHEAARSVALENSAILDLSLHYEGRRLTDVLTGQNAFKT